MGSGTRLERAVKILAVLLGLAYLLIGIVGGAFIDFNTSSDRAFWLGFLIGGGVLLLLGLLLSARSRWLTTVVLAVGAILGALTIFWTVLPALAALALIVMAILWARQPAAAQA
jgi:hypothetical protein